MPSGATETFPAIVQMAALSEELSAASLSPVNLEFFNWTNASFLTRLTATAPPIPKPETDTAPSAAAAQAEARLTAAISNLELLNWTEERFRPSTSAEALLLVLATTTEAPTAPIAPSPTLTPKLPPTLTVVAPLSAWTFKRLTVEVKSLTTTEAP